MATVPSIEEWLSGKNICITGVTGYIGKVLLEKLMRTCPNHGDIYLMIREKRGKTYEERYNEIVNSDLFTFAKVPYHFERLKLISTDFSVAGLGLPNDVLKTLQDNVHIVYHVAASIKFTEPLLDAIKINTRITRDMIELAKGMKNLEAFAHVSTAYTNSDRHNIDEVVYPSKMDWRKAITLAETANSTEIEAVTEKALGEMPNTYCFSKHMAEHVVWEHCNELPILIYRPVIVTSLKYEPEPGWSNNFSGPELVLFAIGKGILRVLNVDGEQEFNYCPGDITVNGLIAATWKLACHSKITKEHHDQVMHTIYVSKSTSTNIEVGHQVVLDNPLTDILWKPHFIPIANDQLFYVLHMLLNVLPNVLFQFAFKIFLRRDVPLVRAVRKFYVNVSIILQFFLKNEFNMKYNNFLKLEASLNESDKPKFYMRIRQEDHILGSKEVERVTRLIGDRYVPKEDRVKHRIRMYTIDKIFRYSMVALFIVFFPYRFVLGVIAGFVNFFTGAFFEE